MSKPPRKFRVWDGEEMHYPPHEYVLYGTGDVHSYDGREGLMFLFSTGLTDAEGNEVWEGDILEHDYSNTPSVVRWSNSHVGFTMDGVYPEVDQIAIETGRKIGNVYENPDLLEQTAGA